MVSDIVAIHRALQTLLFERGQIAREDVDITFEAPSRQWVASLTRPTINLCLCDIRENKELRRTNLETIVTNGRAVHRMPPRRFDLHYMVSALTTFIEDEHELLWRALITLLRYNELPTDVLPASLHSIEIPVTAKIENVPTERISGFVEIWSAFEVSPRPALLYIVTVPIDLALSTDSPLVLKRTARYTVRDKERRTDISKIQIGGTVRDNEGRPIIGARISVVDGVHLPLWQPGSTPEPPPERWFESERLASCVSVVTNSQGQFAIGDLMDAGSSGITIRIERAGHEPQNVTLEAPYDNHEVELK